MTQLIKRLVAIVVLVVAILGTTGHAFAATTDPVGTEEHVIAYKNNAMCFRLNLMQLGHPVFCLPLF